MSNEGVLLLIFGFYGILFLLYFIPTFIAFNRQHPNRWPIFGINLFLGGSGIGWIAALIWALNAVHKSERGSQGGESGLNIFANDPVVVRLEGAAQAVPPQAANDPIEQLAKLKRLHDSGVVDDDEFDRLRKPLVERIRGSL